MYFCDNGYILQLALMQHKEPRSFGIFKQLADLRIQRASVKHDLEIGANRERRTIAAHALNGSLEHLVAVVYTELVEPVLVWDTAQ